LVLSPTGSINLGFTTEGRLADVLNITFSWGFQLGGYIDIYNSYINNAPPTSFPAPLPGNKEEEAPTSTMHQQNAKQGRPGID
jgi:hypothetical protein